MCIIAHIDAGKTTTTERILFNAGVTRYVGEVDEGSAVTDYMDLERERGISITAAAITYPWTLSSASASASTQQSSSSPINVSLIDTPGHVDFTIEVERSLRVVDGAVTLLDASAGVQSQTVTVWRQAGRYSIPKIAFLNKMDKSGANVADSLASLRTRLGANPLLVQLPVGVEKQFRGVLDLVDGTLHLWDEYNADAEKNPLHYRTGRPARRHRFDQALPLLANMSSPERTSSQSGPARELLLSPDVVRRERSRLLAELVELDEQFAELFLGSKLDAGAVDAELLRDPQPVHDAIRRVTLASRALPILLGSAKRNMGVQLLMDAVLRCLPSPLERDYPFLQ